MDKPTQAEIDQFVPGLEDLDNLIFELLKQNICPHCIAMSFTNTLWNTVIHGDEGQPMTKH
jgi:hypothetical protein